MDGVAIIAGWVVAGVVGGIVASQTARRRGRSLAIDILVGLGASIAGGLLLKMAGTTGAWAAIIAVILGALAVTALHTRR